jgi:hypothetical protein
LIFFAGWGHAQAPRPIEVAEPINRALLPASPLPEPLSVAPKGKTVTVRGMVKEFTTAPKGETNGFILDDGTHVSFPSSMSEKVTAAIKKNDRVQVEGRARKTPDGEARQLDAATITNLRTEASVRLSNAVPVASETEPKPNRTADLDQRLKSLEQKVDQVLSELKQMQRNKDGK